MSNCIFPAEELANVVLAAGGHGNPLWIAEALADIHYGTMLAYVDSYGYGRIPGSCDAIEGSLLTADDILGAVLLRLHGRQDVRKEADRLADFRTAWRSPDISTTNHWMDACWRTADLKRAREIMHLLIYNCTSDRADRSGRGEYLGPAERDAALSICASLLTANVKEV